MEELTNKQEDYLLEQARESNCCNANIQDDSDVCSKCGEHSVPEKAYPIIDRYLTEEEKSKFKSNRRLNK